MKNAGGKKAASDRKPGRKETADTRMNARARRRELLIAVSAAVFGGLLVAAVLLVFLPGGERENKPGESPEIGVSGEREREESGILLPGFGSLTLKAGALEQGLTIPNPAGNDCRVRMSLFLEDGTLLWESEYVLPGNSCEPVVLKKALAEGIYGNALLRFDCFTDDDAMLPLNGAETALTLIVMK